MIKKNENCLYCGKKMESETAKRKFCSAKCRVYWNREKMVVQDLTRPTNVAESPKQPTTNFVVDTQRIAELEAELPTIPENTVLGKRRRAWINQEIYKLKYPKQ